MVCARDPLTVCSEDFLAGNFIRAPYSLPVCMTGKPDRSISSLEWLSERAYNTLFEGDFKVILPRFGCEKVSTRMLSFSRSGPIKCAGKMIQVECHSPSASLQV